MNSIYYFFKFIKHTIKDIYFGIIWTSTRRSQNIVFKQEQLKKERKKGVVQTKIKCSPIADEIKAKSN